MVIRSPSTAAVSQLKPSQRTFDQALTVPLALFRHSDDMLREHLASTIDIAINLKGGLVGLDHQPCIIECATQNMNGRRVKLGGVVLEIPVHCLLRY